MDGRPGDGTHPPRRDRKHEYIAMLEASVPLGGAAESTAIAANYMRFDTGASVRRLSFSSSVVEHVCTFGPCRKDIRHLRVGSTK
jgi:hypothetical protein